MKKVILTIASMLAFGASSYAQNTTKVSQEFSSEVKVKVTQKGNLQNASVSQYLTSFDNAEIYQTGNGINKASIIQEGAAAGNNGVIIQDKGINNDASISQTGSGGLTFDNNAKIEQYGNSNVGLIGQSEDSFYNDAQILQGPLSNFNKAAIHQAALSTRNKATITQKDGSVGAGNEAKITQASLVGFIDVMDNTASISQSSTGNKSTITQGSGLTELKNNYATVIQDGQNGNVTLKQISEKGLTSGNVAKVTQDAISLNSKATINQSDANTNGVVLVNQQGTGDVVITQLGSNRVIAEVNQNGGVISKHTASILQQDGVNSKATINQLSPYGIENNNASINQIGVSSSTAIINQGDFNGSPINSKATINQKMGANNVALFEQTWGNENTAEINQIGANNKVYGATAGSFASQSGDKAALTINQTGGVAGNVSFVIQAYANNSSVVINQTNN